MLDNFRRYLWDRRRGALKFAGVVGGLYLVTSYLLERLEEMREAIRQEKLAKENLKMRFLKNKQDCIFTILALLPGLGAQITEDMDVEGITQVLQGRSRHREDNGLSSREPSVASNASNQSLSNQNAPSLPTLNASGEPIPHAATGFHSVVPSESANEDQPIPGAMADSSLSWVEQFTATSGGSNGARSPSIAEAQLSDSMISGTLSTTSEVLSDLSQASSLADRLTGRTKGELWKDVKHLTFSRTLTIIYSTCLLTLLTHIQLNLIGRAKYLRSVAQLNRKEQEENEFSIGSLVWDTISSSFFDNRSSDVQQTPIPGAQLTEETEKKYLLLSWWLTHRGWRQIGHATRQAVEDALSSVSLKSKIDLGDVQWIVADARSRLESTNTGDNMHGPNFLSVLLPPDVESLDQALTAAGSPVRLLPSQVKDEEFEALLSESRELISSPSFSLALDASLETSFRIFFEYLEREVFDSTGRRATQPLRLVDILPGMSRWNHVAINALPNELVDTISSGAEMTGFSAQIFSSFEGKFEW